MHLRLWSAPEHSSGPGSSACAATSLPPLPPGSLYPAPTCAACTPVLGRNEPVGSPAQCCVLPRSIPATLGRTTGRPSTSWSGCLVFSRLFCILLFAFPNTTALVGQTGILVQGRAARASPMFIALPEPCFQRGIRTNGKRALAAVLFSRSILPQRVASHRPVQSGLAGGAAFRRLGDPGDEP
jgi:hypothetical protein